MAGKVLNMNEIHKKRRCKYEKKCGKPTTAHTLDRWR